jgi:hypothetical protein
MEIEINNTDLSPADIPVSALDLQAVSEFALSFDGYAHWGERCGDRANRAAAEFHETGRVPTDVAALRACLFYEQGRLHWSEGTPDDRWTAWIQALLDAIRSAATP